MTPYYLIARFATGEDILSFIETGPPHSPDWLYTVSLNDVRIITTPSWTHANDITHRLDRALRTPRQTPVDPQERRFPTPCLRMAPGCPNSNPPERRRKRRRSPSVPNSPTPHGSENV